MKNKFFGRLLTLCAAAVMSITFATAAMAEGEVYVAQVGKTKYTTLQDAVDAAQPNDVVILLEDVTADSVIEVKKTITIDGGNRTLFSQANRGIWVAESDVDLTVRNLTIEAAEGNQGFERALQVNVGFKNVGLTVINCKLYSTYYAVNITNETTVDIDIQDSYIQAWSALNLWSGGNTVNVKSSTLVGINDKSYDSEGWNGFATVVLEGDTTEQTDDHSHDNIVTFTDCTFIAKSDTENKQGIFLFNSQSCNNHVVVTGEKTFVGESNSYVVLDNGEGNSISIEAGIFDKDVQQWCATGYIGNEEKDGLYKVHQHDTNTFKHHPAKDATCEDSGNIEYWECTVSNKLFSDANATKETTLQAVTIPPKGHTLTKANAKEATCTEKGYTGDMVCTVCGKTVTAGQEIAIDPNNHDLKLVKAVDATTTATGVREHYECTRCDSWFWDADAKNLIADHKEVVLAKKTEETKDLSGTVVVIADSNVDTSVESNPELSQETKDAVQTVGIKDGQESADALTGNIAQIANAVDTDNALKETAKEKLGIDDTNSIQLVVKPYVKVTEVGQEKSESDPLPTVIRMNIDLVYTVEAKNVSDAGAAPVEIQSEQKLDNNQIKNDTQIQIIVPTTGVWESRKVLIRHETENHGVQYYFATVEENGYVTFTVPAEHGFSPFAVMPYDERTVTVKLDGEQKTYNFMDVVNGTALPAPSKNNYAFKGWKFEGIVNQHFNMTAELFEELLDKNAVVVGSSVFEGPLSEHPEIEEAKKNGTWGVDKNKPAATAKPAAAAAVTPVRSSIPKTSDDSNLMLWVCLMGLAALGLGGALYLKKRSNK